MILGLADKILEAVKSGQIGRFYVIGGCDGAEIGRNYYTRLAQQTPQQSVILTLGCGKYRIRNHDYGTVAGLLSLLALGVRGIRLGPLPPAFVSPNVFRILQQKFDLKLTEAEPPLELVTLGA